MTYTHSTRLPLRWLTTGQRHSAALRALTARIYKAPHFLGDITSLSSSLSRRCTMPKVTSSHTRMTPYGRVQPPENQAPPPGPTPPSPLLSRAAVREEAPAQEPPPPPSPFRGAPRTPADILFGASRDYPCELCGISTTSRESLEDHLWGKRHGRRLRWEQEQQKK